MENLVLDTYYDNMVVHNIYSGFLRSSILHTALIPDLCCLVLSFFNCRLLPGTRIMVRDRTNTFLLARVIQPNIDTGMRCKVHFIRWGNVFDEVVPQTENFFRPATQEDLEDVNIRGELSSKPVLSLCDLEDNEYAHYIHMTEELHLKKDISLMAISALPNKPLNTKLQYVFDV